MSQAAIAHIQQRRLQVEEFGQTTAVPNDNVARLMYYLHCISSILDNCVPGNLTNFREYNALSNAERLQVIALACELGPDKLPMLIEVQSLPDGSGNSFFKFSSLDETVTALGIQRGGAAMMALRRQVGNKQELIQIMAYTPQWLRNNYLGPLMAIKRDVELASLIGGGRKTTSCCCCTVL